KAAELVARGQASYDAKQFEEAEAFFRAAMLRAPESAVPPFNAAAASYQLMRFDEARRLYLEARERADQSLRTKIDYALGNTALLLGDIAGAISHYDDCIDSKARGAGLDSVRRDAAVNRDFAFEQQMKSIVVPEGQDSGEPSQTRRPDRRRPPGNGPD